LSIRHCLQTKPEAKGNVIRVKLSPDVIFDEKKLSRNFYMTSSCGVCGKTSIEAIAFSCLLQNNKPFAVKSDIILSLNEKIMAQQLVFKHTGGLHAAALFSKNGDFLCLYEDVGRHNAADKLFGNYFLENQLPLHEHILFLSGRTSYELMQKAAMAGIKVVCSVGAPSHLAILLAQKFDMILIGFLKNNYFNIYHGKEYITT
jgi:FdhD protein